MAPKQFVYKPPKRFAVGTKVRVRNPGVDGVVLQLDDERKAMSEYWHTVQTKYGERREPGCNLELIPEPLTNRQPWTPKVAEHIHVHGTNSRINVGSTDNSTNISTSDSFQVFATLDEKAATIADEAARDKILSAIAEMKEAEKTGGFLNAYQHFVSVAADHLTLFLPVLPLLTQLLTH